MNFKATVIAAAIALGVTYQFAHAQENIDQASLKAAEEKLATSFSGISVTAFGESPIKGIYELKAGGNIIYFYPGDEENKGIIIIGEMYDEDGQNLTDNSKKSGLSDTLKELKLDSAITIGPKDAPVFYEFTDPDCPYCHEYDEWMKTYSKEHPVQRKLIFMVNPGHPLARAKIEHVICSDDKDEAVRYVYSSELPHNPDGANAMQMAKQKSLKTCQEANTVIEEHAKILQALGVNGTPSFLFNSDTKPKLIIGFSQQKIADAISEIEKPAISKLEKEATKTTK